MQDTTFPRLLMLMEECGNNYKSNSGVILANIFSALKPEADSDCRCVPRLTADNFFQAPNKASWILNEILPIFKNNPIQTVA